IFVVHTSIFFSTSSSWLLMAASVPKRCVAGDAVLLIRVAHVVVNGRGIWSMVRRLVSDPRIVRVRDRSGSDRIGRSGRSAGSLADPAQKNRKKCLKIRKKIRKNQEK